MEHQNVRAYTLPQHFFTVIVHRMHSTEPFSPTKYFSQFETFLPGRTGLSTGPRLTTAFWKPNCKDLYELVWEFIERSIKRLKWTETVIKVSKPHKELCLCCFLTVSRPINAILARFDVSFGFSPTKKKSRDSKLGCTRLSEEKAPKITINPVQSRTSLEHPSFLVNLVPNIES